MENVTISDRNFFPAKGLKYFIYLSSSIYGVACSLLEVIGLDLVGLSTCSGMVIDSLSNKRTQCRSIFPS